MKREEVRTLLENASKALSETVRFNSGRITEFNSNRSNEYPFIWLESLSRDTSFNDNQVPFDDWNVVLHFAKKDAAGSTPEQYEPIIDECDLLAKQFIYKLNHVLDGYKLITLSGINSEPFIHVHADDTTGVILSFTLNSVDKTDVC